ncbi:MAG: hypothetical protein KME38_28460 [Spirirestis rafaelensis WJT71-NPBG6]|jgi:hypothetical protein|nr:hypothetical protein [Spirirestis rafaelensis WJT71-NPBG6]
MARHQWKLSALKLMSFAPIAALGLLSLPVQGQAATKPASMSSETSAKLQQFDLNKMSVEQISDIKNSVLRTLLENSKDEAVKVGRMYDSHGSSHSKNSLRKPVEKTIAQTQSHPDTV